MPVDGYDNPFTGLIYGLSDEESVLETIYKKRDIVNNLYTLPRSYILIPNLLRISV